MTLAWHIPADTRHHAAVAAFAGVPGLRVGRFDLNGETYWIKRVDRPGLINRLQKGPPLQAFDADLAAMKALAARGVPVPDIVAEGPGVFVTRDSGPTLDRILRDQTGTVDERLQMFGAAGQALARIHRLGVSHGRPVLRDICWKDGRITLLDFENYRPHRNRPKDFARDLIIFVFSCYAQRAEDLPEIVAAQTAYRANDPGGIWALAADWLGGKRWIETLTRPLRNRPEPHAREFKAIPPTFRAFGL